MRWYYKLPLRLRSLFKNRQAEYDLGDEIQFHLQCQAEEYVAQGMGPEEARCAALRSLGGIEQVKEECRKIRNVSFIESLHQDLHFGFRMLHRSPGFSILAILCLTLGIGAMDAGSRSRQAREVGNVRGSAEAVFLCASAPGFLDSR